MLSVVFYRFSLLIPVRWIVAIIHRTVEAILWIPLEQKVTVKKVMHKLGKSRPNLKFLIQRYRKNRKLDVVVSVH